jgi:glucose/arabinose dehydrogenase/cytochrome c551/c552
MFFLRLAALALFAQTSAFAQDAGVMARGEKIYVEKCSLCHQIVGAGVPPVYPPLAESDWFAGDRERTIKVLCEGLSGPIEVRGQRYANTMPAQVLDDAQVADVLSYVGASWGNTVKPFMTKEVAAARMKTGFKTYADLLKATAYPPLPKAPAGWSLREAAQLPEFCTRLATHGDNSTIYALAQTGAVYFLDAASGAMQLLIKTDDYLDPARGDLTALGFMQDAEKRLWIVTDQRIKNGEGPVLNEVTIHRTTAMSEGHPIKPQPWFTVRIPFGVGPYNHGVGHLAIGPDGMLYVNSGSRTDGGEAGTDPHYSKEGETDITACLWKLDPRAEQPKIEVVARGIRNAYGFAWDGDGHLFTVSNGPDYNAPEEMDFIEPGRHYGFPFQFSTLPVKPHFPYPHTPPAPPGLVFTPPVLNVGPAGGGSAKKPLGTFDAHSSPAGMIWCGDDFPEPLRRTFLITRFGNLLGESAAPEDVGFDVLCAKMERQGDGPEKRWRAQVNTVLAPLGRPLDVVRAGPGRAFILEYTRPTDFKNKLGWLPGRILELAPASP